MTAIFVCTAPTEGPWANSCVSCGGYTHVEGGPFVAPEGSILVAAVYCSEECWEEWEEVLVRERIHRAKVIALCPSCGFDNQEHDDYCGLLARGIVG